MKKQKGFLVNTKEKQPMKPALKMFVIAVLLLGCSHIASAQVNSNTVGVNLSATVGESVSVSVDTNSVDLSDGAQHTINVTTSWNVASTRTTVDTVAYFTSSTALTGPTTIPVSDVFGQGQDGNAPCTQTLALPDGGHTQANACAYIFSVGVSSANNNYSGSSTNPFKISIPNIATFQAGTYVGTLTISAAAI